MARFIIKVDDKVLEDYMSPMNIVEKLESSNPVKAFTLGISASIIKEDMDKGITTFTITDNAIDERLKPMFEQVVEELIGLNAALILTAKKEEKENEEENKEEK